MTSSQDGTSTPPLRVSGVARPRLDNTFANFEASTPSLKAAKALCIRVAQGKAASAFLAGPPGTGKTHMAIAAMHEYGLDRSFFWKVPDFLDWLRNQAFGADEGSRVPVDTLTKNYRQGEALIVFDDLGVEKDTEWASEQLYRVLDSRYEFGLPTILTTNVPESQLSPRLLSRFAAGLVVCKAPDFRRAK